MGKFKFLIFVLLLSVSVKSTFADIGCQYTSGYIYYVPKGTYNGNPPGPNPNGTYPNYRCSSGADQIMNTNVYCLQATTASCRIDGSSGDWGVIINYTTTQCPLDEYVPFLILPIGIFGFSFCEELVEHLMMEQNF